VARGGRFADLARAQFMAGEDKPKGTVKNPLASIVET
jgi:hypothetical protein